MAKANTHRIRCPGCHRVVQAVVQSADFGFKSVNNACKKPDCAAFGEIGDGWTAVIKYAKRSKHDK